MDNIVLCGFMGCGKSTVGRNIARKTGKKFVAVSCHYDILDWLQPDWVFDTNKMQCFFGNAHDRKNNMKSENAIAVSGQNLGVIII